MACAKVPLDEQHVTEIMGPMGREQTIPALHPDRKEERCFLPYKPPPEDNSSAQIEEYLEQAQFISEDLDWLLSLPHDKFWCQVVFDESLQRCLDSYLRYAPRTLDTAQPVSSPAVADMERCVHRSVFMVFLRMATHKESKENFITPEVFGEIIYNNFLFDIPKMMDLCVLFGKGNAQLLHKMIENIFTQQPCYYGDLNETVPSILQVLGTVLERCGLQSEGATASEPLKLGSHDRPTSMTMPQKDLVDLIVYMCDTCTTLHAFLDIFPEACETFHSHGVLSRLTSFYEMVVPDLEKALRKRNFDKSVQEDLWSRLCHSRKRMVEIAHLLLQHTCLQPILEGAENMQSSVEDLLQNFTNFIQEKRFLADYDEQFPLADDISLLQQVSPHLDETRTSYLLQAVESAWDSVGKKRGRPPVPSAGAAAGASARRGAGGAGAGGLQGAAATAAAVVEDFPQKGDNGAVCTISSGELESLLTHIRELLPDLGEGFILACLEEYGYSSELVINNILEDRLSPSLDKLDRAMPRPVREEPPEVLSTRSNVFDDDEFDVFQRDQVDMDRVWKGKKKGQSLHALLDDKQHIAEQKARYLAYETVVEEVLVDPNDPGFLLDDYDDEYDDTYDINQVGANDLDDDDDLLNRRPFTTPLVLQMHKKSQGKEEEEYNEEEEENKDGGVKRDMFIQDPAVLRQRAEARRASMQHRRGGYRPPPSNHVEGGAKGQGQSKETVLDRRKKEANKSRGANHNRRNMADRKRNKGMIPS
ncbi:activating signal cointegrator 1 complex subunit 2 [Clupea harengus]|uniref:Activating signal cointegrator 1 complex subunit 2 n=1 Tax=Clupea harengus TaxID=7950 RepID=A0A6P3VML9_CLUHA|nr:activating signal cointegrator 1 complex subunit 2 [Clupea harengus]